MTLPRNPAIEDAEAAVRRAYAEWGRRVTSCTGFTVYYRKGTTR